MDDGILDAIRYSMLLYGQALIKLEWDTKQMNTEVNMNNEYQEILRLTKLYPEEFNKIQWKSISEPTTITLPEGCIINMDNIKPTIKDLIYARFPFIVEHLDTGSLSEVHPIDNELVGVVPPYTTGKPEYLRRIVDIKWDRFRVVDWIEIGLISGNTEFNHKCTCDIVMIMQRGCTCNGV